MNYQEILQLVRAGYTRDEINAMAAQPQPGAAPATPAQPQADPTPAQTTPASAQTAQQISNEDLAKLLTAFIQQTVTQPAQQTVTQPAQQTVTQPAQQTVTQPAQPAQPAQQTQSASLSQDAEQILRSLGAYTQGVAIPKPETLDERMANTLKLALGIHEETKK